LRITHLAITGLFAFLVLSPIAASAQSNWTPEEGDRVVVDLSVSVVYLVHKDGTYKALDGLTGQHRVVAYDGIVYNAATPERTWEIGKGGLEKKGRSMTFGEGRFMRLSWPGHTDERRGNESTAYGIHSHLTFAKMMQEKKDKVGFDKAGTGYRSMGCILVSEDDLTLIADTWSVNGEYLSVVTQNGVDPVAFAPANSRPSWLGWLVD
jgi:hypothetical protein